MHPDFNLNTIAHQDLPLPLSTLPRPAFYWLESEAQLYGEERVFLGRENMVSARAW